MATPGACRRCSAPVSDADRACPKCGQTDPYRELLPWEKRAHDEAKGGNEPEAVKIVREHTGLGRAEATHIVQSWLR